MLCSSMTNKPQHVSLFTIMDMETTRHSRTPNHAAISLLKTERKKDNESEIGARRGCIHPLSLPLW